MPVGRIAQLVRAPRLHRGGQGFESLFAHLEYPISHMIDRQMLELYQRRWQDVAQVEAHQWREATITQRWRQLNALLRMAAALGLQLESEELLDDSGRWRWNRLVELYVADEKGRDL